VDAATLDVVGCRHIVDFRVPYCSRQAFDLAFIPHPQRDLEDYILFDVPDGEEPVDRQLLEPLGIG
jgi:hypothetical protein